MPQVIGGYLSLWWPLGRYLSASGANWSDGILLKNLVVTLHYLQQFGWFVKGGFNDSLIENFV